MAQFAQMDISAILDSAEMATAWAEKQAQEALAMREATIKEEGLLNVPQTAILLDISPQRVRELMNLGILSRFEFMGHVYLSCREVRTRRDQEVKAGRPKRSVLTRLAVGIKAATLTDGPQWKQGGYAGPYVKEKEEASKRRSRPKK